jgi:cobalamin transport system substrate-binding protein
MEIIIKKLSFILAALLIFIIAIVIADSFSSSETKTIAGIEKGETLRIISLSPSITETLFALNLGEKVVGKTRFCNYPPDAKGISEVGGYLDLNYEGVIALQPDLVILLPEHEKIKQHLSELKIKCLEVEKETISEIINSIKTIGDSCGAQNEAANLIANINMTISEIKKKTENLRKPKTIISIGRTMGEGTLKDVYIAGSRTYFSELIDMAGGANAYQEDRGAYPILSAEGLIHINPEVIIDLAANLKENGLSKEKIIQEWQSIGSVDAVKNGRVTILDSDYVVIPGPRFIFLLKDLAKTIHPEISWNF